LVRQLDLGVELIRDAPAPTLLPFTRFFKGFESVPPVVSTFGTDAADALRDLKVEFFSSRFGYMAVSHRDAHVIVSTRHLKGSDFRTLYLDIIHELFHVVQFRRERESFLAGYTRLIQNPLSYFRNPMEIAAYRHTVEEAYRIGMTQEEVTEYLEVGWVPPNEHVRFLKRVGVERKASPRPERTRPPVRIARHAPITLRPFTDYFRGFENVVGIRALFGGRTEQVLNRLKVEFYSMPMGYMGLDQEGGYLSVSSPYLRDSDLSTLYLDVFFCLQSLKQFREGRLLVPYSPKWQKTMNRIAKERHLKETSVGDNPNTIEALKPTVEEARRIGMSDAEIRGYLLAPELGGMTAERHRRLLRNLGLAGVGRRT
jgi:hypothetical protein